MKLLYIIKCVKCNIVDIPSHIFVMVIFRGYLPWEFAAAICRGYLPWEFAAAICHGYLPGFFLVYVSKPFFCVSKSFFYCKQIFFNWKQTFFICEQNFFLFTITSLLTVFLFVIARGSYGPP